MVSRTLSPRRCNPSPFQLGLLLHLQRLVCHGRVAMARIGKTTPGADPEKLASNNLPLGNSGWQWSKDDKPNDCQEANPSLLSTMQSAWGSGGGSANCNGLTSLSAQQRELQNALSSLD